MNTSKSHPKVRIGEIKSGALVVVLCCFAAAGALGAAMQDGAPEGAAAQYPSFERVLLLESTSETSANVSIGDLDADGHLDIVLAKGRHWPLVNRVLFGDGHGGFPRAHDLSEVSDRTYSGRLVDLDADGDLDVVISNDSPDPKRVYLNDGQGRFRESSTYGHPEWPTRNASVADLDGDGLPDIIVANRAGGGGSNFVCLNEGDGQFDAECIGFSNESATTVTPMDFGNDGVVDLVVPHRDGGQSYVYLNDGKAGFSTTRRVPFGPSDAAVRVAEAVDLDGDGLVDIVTIDERRGASAYFGQPDSTFSAGFAIELVTDAIPYALAVGDVDLDGTTDVIVGHIEAAATVHFNDGSGRSYTSVEFGDGQGAAYGFAIGDLDEDGWPDIAVARSGAPNAVYFAKAPARR